MPTKFTFLVHAGAKAKTGASFATLKSTKKNHIGQSLPSHHRLTAAAITAAALETGYGPKTQWTANRVMNPTERHELARFLVSRARTMLRMFDVVNGKLKVRDFNRLLDSSDKTSMHYALGQVGAAIAMQLWLGSAPRRIIHAGPLAKAMIKKNSAIKMLPDFLVEDQQSRWHALEAKAGLAGYKKTAITKGLKQLSAIQGFLPSAGGPKRLIDCRVCSFVEIPKPGNAIEFTVVDPPGDSGEVPLLFVDLAEAEQYLQVDEALRSLPRARTVQDGSAQDGIWRSVGFGSVQVMVPQAGKELRELRWRVDLMLAALDCSLTELLRISRPLPERPTQSFLNSRSDSAREVLGRAGLLDHVQASRLLEQYEVHRTEQISGPRLREHLLSELERRLRLSDSLDALKVRAVANLAAVKEEFVVTHHAVYRASPASQRMDELNQ